MQKLVDQYQQVHTLEYCNSGRNFNWTAFNQTSKSVIIFNSKGA